MVCGGCREGEGAGGTVRVAGRETRVSLVIGGAQAEEAVYEGLFLLEL